MSKNQLLVQQTIVTLTRVNNSDFISLTDIARVKNSSFYVFAKEFVNITITLDGTSDFISAVTYKEYDGKIKQTGANQNIVTQTA